MQSDITCIPLVRRNLPAMIRFLIAQYEIQVVYSLLNASDESTEVTLELSDSGIDMPIVRHYKEHPCTPTVEERRVLLETDGQIYINEHSFEYFRKLYGVHSWSAHIMDADMIAERYMLDKFSQKLRIKDGEPHLLVAGGMSMLNDRLDVRELCVQMNQRRVHVHLYGYMMSEDQNFLPIIHHLPTRRAYERLASTLPYIHLHDYIGPDQFSVIWSRYDAGFMHSKVDDRDKAAAFEKMNYPHRYTAYLAAGLPLVVHGEGQDAMEALVKKHGIGIVFSDYDDLAEKLYDSQLVTSLTSTAYISRKKFSFDSNAGNLVSILETYARR
jgi:glycosyltransferase involved in cell wall biosynthesis